MSFSTRTATIPNGASYVDVEMKGDTLLGYVCPSALTGTLALQAVFNGVACDINGFASTFSAGDYVPVVEGTLKGVPTLRIGTGGAEAAARQFILAIEES